MEHSLEIDSHPLSDQNGKSHESRKHSRQGTLHNNLSVSQTFNNKALKLSMKPIYASNPFGQLKRIFKKVPLLPLQSNRTQSNPARKSIDNRTPRRKVHFDSSFNKGEAKIIMSELKKIKNPRVWKEVMSGFQAKPGLLLDLIPLKKLEGSRSAMNRNKKNFRFTSRKVSPPKEEISPAYTPEVVETLKNEDDEHLLTEDWKKSLLNFNLRATADFVCDKGYSQAEIEKVNYALPPDETSLKEIQTKCLNTLEVLLIELLGTKKDVSRFNKRFRHCIPSTIKALISKCLDMFNVRNITADLLIAVNRRERLMRKIKYLEGSELKKVILAIYELSSAIRNKIEKWIESPVVPFDDFIFNGKVYLQKMTEDNVFLQRILLSACEAP